MNLNVNSNTEIMNSSAHSGALLKELNETKQKELIPLYLILSLLLLFGLLGNLALIAFVWKEARRNVGTFFLLILSVVDIFICLTVPAVIVEYSKLYIFTSDAICKLSVFCRFLFTLFSVFVLIAISVYRYRKICHPFKEQLGMNGARTATICSLVCALILSLPQFFLVETAQMEVQYDSNLTLFGSDCVVKTLHDEDLKEIQTVMEAIYGVLFIGLFSVLLILYSLQGRAIFLLNRTHAKLTRTTHLACISTASFDDVQLNAIEQNVDNGEMIPEPPPTPSHIHREQAREASRRKREQILIRRQKSAERISSTKMSVMFFIIALGFILSFLPYIIYSLWRMFSASPSDVAFTVSPVHLFCLNSYLINSVINYIVYGFFNSSFREYLKNCISCRKKTPLVRQRIC